MESSEAHGQIVSDTPGRLRIRLRRAHRHPHVMERARNHLRERDAISHVVTNDTTGSVMIRYDPGKVSRDDVLGMLRDVGVIARAAAADVGIELPDESHRSTTALGLVAAVNDLDRRLSRATGRKVDLKLLFPAGLFAIGIRQVATEGLGLTTVPGYVLLWYAFDSFWKFHARQPTTVETGQRSEDMPAAEEGEARRSERGRRAAAPKAA